MDRNISWYAERQPEFSEAGEFEAAIYGSDRPVSSGRSYAAFAIRRKGEDIWRGTGHPSGGRSEEYRAYVAAAVGVLEALPPKSTVRILTHHKTICQAFMEWLPSWEKNGWKRRKNGPLAAEEIFKRFIKVARERQIAWTFILIGDGDPLFFIIEQLDAEIAKHSDKDGSPLS